MLDDIAILTACFGGYDKPPAQAEQDIGVDWYAFTDGSIFPDNWKVLETHPIAANPRIAAKRYKCAPSDYLPHRYTIWIDANTEIISPTFARDAIGALHDG